MPYIHRLFHVLLILFPLFANMANGYSQQKVNGYVLDIETGESLPGANIITYPWGTGTTTNQYGYFSMSLPNQTQKVTISYIGYKPIEISTSELPDSTLILFLEPGYILNDVTVKTNTLQNFIATPNSPTLKLRQSEFKQAGSIFGEPDLLKKIQTLPGISQGKEGGSEIYVRGGHPGQNLIMLDGAPVYNINHAFGLLSIFNVDALKEATIYKGGIPARFGGRLSSVIDVWGREGNENKNQGSFFFSTIGAGLTLEGPVVKKKSTWLLSARRSWPDLLYSGFQSLSSNGRFVPGISFSDITARVNFKLGTDRLFLNLYHGKDNFFVRSETATNKTNYHLSWGNYLASAGYTSVLSSDLFAHALVYFSNYFDKEESENSSQAYNDYFERLSLFRELGTKLSLDWQINTNLLIKTGIAGSYQRFRPAKTNQSLQGRYYSENSPLSEIKTLNLYGEGIWSTEQWNLQAGIRTLGEKRDGKSITAILPRLSIGHNLSEQFALKASGMITRQSFYVLSKSSSGWPGYFYVPAPPHIDGSLGKDLSVGFNVSSNRKWNIDVQGYIRQYKNIAASYEIPSDAFAQIDWAEKIKIGDGRSSGLEFLGEYNYPFGALKLAYTLSRTQVKYNEYYDGQWFNGDYDRRHDLHLNLLFSLKNDATRKRQLSFNFYYRTGQPLTLPSSEVSGLYPPLLKESYWYDFSFIPHYSGPNNTRMPDYHRLDISYETTKKKKHGARTLSFGLYNAYNRQNPYLIYFDNDDNAYKQLTLFPVMPFIMWKRTF